MIFGYNTVQIYHNTATMSEISRDAYFMWGWAKWFAKVSITDEIFAHLHPWLFSELSCTEDVISIYVTARFFKLRHKTKNYLTTVAMMKMENG